MKQEISWLGGDTQGEGAGLGCSCGAGLTHGKVWRAGLRVRILGESSLPLLGVQQPLHHCAADPLHAVSLFPRHRLRFAGCAGTMACCLEVSSVAQDVARLEQAAAGGEHQVG